MDPDRADGWSAKEVAARWLKLHPVRNGYFQPIEATEYEIGELVEKDQWVDTTRDKLCSISQFMKELKQRIAQTANRVDHATGAFWEGRYKVKAVHDEAQLLTTMAYIDLNPFAANLCKTPEEGRYTSLEGRLDRDKPRPVQEVRPGYESRGKKQDAKVSVDPTVVTPKHQKVTQPAIGAKGRDQTVDVRQPSSTWLLPLDDEVQGKQESAAKRRNRKVERQAVLPGLTVRLYLNIVDTVARLMRDGKKRLARNARPILERLSLTPDALADAVRAMRDHWASELSQGDRITDRIG